MPRGLRSRLRRISPRIDLAINRPRMNVLVQNVRVRNVLQCQLRLNRVVHPSLRRPTIGLKRIHRIARRQRSPTIDRLHPRIVNPPRSRRTVHRRRSRIGRSRTGTSLLHGRIRRLQQPNVRNRARLLRQRRNLRRRQRRSRQSRKRPKRKNARKKRNRRENSSESPERLTKWPAP